LACSVLRLNLMTLPRTRRDMENIINQLERKSEDLTEKIGHSVKKAQDARMIERNKNARIKYAKSIGLKPNELIEKNVRKSLNEQIILEVKSRKLTHKVTHHDIAICIGSSRPNITAIMNRRLKHVTTDMLVKILSMIGVDIQISL
jgi:predicted XRE-type DNA-binding protein